jgi:hypothetical protein
MYKEKNHLRSALFAWLEAYCYPPYVFFGREKTSCVLFFFLSINVFWHEDTVRCDGNIKYDCHSCCWKEEESFFLRPTFSFFSACIEKQDNTWTAASVWQEINNSSSVYCQCNTLFHCQSCLHFYHRCISLVCTIFDNGIHLLRLKKIRLK